MTSQKEEEFKIMAALHGAKLSKKDKTVTDADIDKSAGKAGFKIEEI